MILVEVEGGTQTSPELRNASSQNATTAMQPASPVRALT